MNYKKIILVIISILGIFITNKYYVDHISLSFPLFVFLVFHLILLFRNINHLTFSFTKLIISLFIACFWLYSSYNGMTHLTKEYIRYFVSLVSIITITFTFYLLITELEKPFASKKVTQNKWWILIYAVIPIGNWLRYFLAYYPAKMTFDSFWQWSMAHGIKQYNAWHPILHTLWIQLASSIYNSPSTYIISQIIVVAFIIGYSLFVLQTYGVPKWILIAVSLAYAFYPINGYYMVTMWKDIPFAAFILLMTVYFTRIVQSDGQWLDNKKHCIVFIIGCFVSMNLRNNGFLALILALICLIFLMNKIRKKMILISGIIVAIHFLFNYPLMSYLHVIKNPLNQALAIPSQQIAATYKSNGNFTPELKSYFNSILPEENWKKDYNPYTVDPIKHDSLYKVSVINNNFKKYLLNWAKLLQMNIGTYVKAYLDQVSVLWQFYSPIGYKVYIGSPLNLDDYPISLKLMTASSLKTSNNQSQLDILIKSAYNSYKKEIKTRFPNGKVVSYGKYKKLALKSIEPLKTESKSLTMKNRFDEQFKRLQIGIKQSLFVKGAIYFFILLISLVASLRRYKLKGFIVFAPAVFVLLTIAIGMPATDFRYSYSFIMSVPFLLFYGKLKSSSNMESLND